MTIKTVLRYKLAIVAMILLTLVVTTWGAGSANATIVRESYATITDAGRFTQHCDTIRLPEDKEIIKNRGWAYILVTIKSVIYEKDDGYQSIMIYVAADPAAAMIDDLVFEHSPGGTSTKMKTVVNMITIDVAHLTHNEIVLRYGASGYGADTYHIKNLEVEFSYTNQFKKHTAIS